MCGIAGCLAWDAPLDAGAVRRMTDRLTHRGPDACGYFCRGPIALGHRRLSIIDLSAAANQPMSDASGLFWIVYNGEVYNFQELRSRLARDGAHFKSHSDTEVILEAYKRWDLSCLDHLNGMFAFALWDEPKRRLVLARDRAGEKPLFYHPLGEDGVVFASDLNSLQQHPSVGRRINPEALSQFLSIGYVLAPDSLIAGVKRLEPAHALVADRGKPLRTWRYWNLAEHFGAKRTATSEDDAAEELAALIDDAVRIRLISDVPIGAFLSGGLDSSTIVAAMNRARPAEQNVTFSVGFGERSYDELPEARAVAAALGVRHHDQVVHPDISTGISRLADFMDEPLADTSTIPVYFLAGFARERVTVCLSGDGADESFAGYDTYTADRLRRLTAWVPGALMRAAASTADAVLPVSFVKIGTAERIRRFLHGQALDSRRAHCAWRLIVSDTAKSGLLRPELHAALAAHDPFDRFDAHFRDVRDCHYLDQAMYVDIKTWLADDILVKVDRMTMAHSLEARAPFLDHRIVEFAASLPVEWKLKNWRKKRILKRSQQRRLPARTLARPKRGFNAPVSHWFTGPLRDLGHAATAPGVLGDWFDRAAVERLWTEHGDRTRDHGLTLFGLTCLGLWRTRTSGTL